MGCGRTRWACGSGYWPTATAGQPRATHRLGTGVEGVAEADEGRGFHSTSTLVYILNENYSSERFLRKSAATVRQARTKHHRTTMNSAIFQAFRFEFRAEASDHNAVVTRVQISTTPDVSWSSQNLLSVRHFSSQHTHLSNSAEIRQTASVTLRPSCGGAVQSVVPCRQYAVRPTVKEIITVGQRG